MSENKPGRFTRRDIIGGGITVGLAGLVAKKYYELSAENAEKVRRVYPSGIDRQKTNEPVFSDFPESLIPPPFSDIPDLEVLTPDENWNSERLQVMFENAIKQSKEQNGATVEVNLALDEETGEEITHERLILLDREVITQIPEGTSIAIKGNGKVRIQLSEELSKIPSAWETPQKNNGIEFTDVEGKILIDGITFDGGSKRAGREGYPPPGGPWDAVLYINGTGPGSGKKPERDPVQNSRKGKATVTNCGFYNTESAACYMKNLSEANMQDCTGKNFDAIWCISWCDSFNGRNIQGQNALSDGIAAYCCDKGTIADSQIKTARQGFLLQGCQRVEIVNCYAEDCAKAIDLYRFKEDDTKYYPIADITINRTSSRGCGMSYSIGNGTNIVINNNTHDTIGEWYNKDDFMHTGIAFPEQIENFTAPLWVENVSDVKFKNVSIRQSAQSTKKYIVSPPYKVNGVQFYNF